MYSGKCALLKEMEAPGSGKHRYFWESSSPLRKIELLPCFRPVPEIFCNYGALRTPAFPAEEQPGVRKGQQFPDGFPVGSAAGGCVPGGCFFRTCLVRFSDAVQFYKMRLFYCAVGAFPGTDNYRSRLLYDADHISRLYGAGNRRRRRAKPGAESAGTSAEIRVEIFRLFFTKKHREKQRGKPNFSKMTMGNPAFFRFTGENVSHETFCFTL